MRRCLNGVFCGLILMAVAGIFLVLLPMLFKIRPQVVLSGSMEPEIPVGSIVYITDTVLPEEIQTGDVIAYRMGESLNVLHRVIRIEEEEQGFRTKGDANRQEDLGIVGFSQYEGKAVLCIPYLGYAVKFLQTGHRMLWIGCIIAGLAAADSFFERREGGQETCREKNGK